MNAEIAVVSRQANARAFHAALVRIGFVRIKEGVARDSSEARVICSAGVSRKSLLADVTVGFWLHQLSDSPPPQFFHHCHIYGSLGSVVPRFRGLEVVKGRRDEEAWQELIDNSEEIADALESLLTIPALQRAFDQGRFAECMILKEARAFLKHGDSESGEHASDVT